MKSENKRIFISDLPEPVNREELQSSFSSYGQVSSVEIKQRKELGPNNKSLFFAYVNLFTDDKSLNKCFKDLSGTKWHGQYVQLQLARESFLERLKRERQETEGKEKNHMPEINTNELIPTIVSRNSLEIKNVHYKPKDSQVQIHKQNKLSSESDTSESLSDTDSKHLSKSKDNLKLETTEKGEKLDIVVKCNKNKLSERGVLKIASIGNAPIVEITRAKTKVKHNNSEANMKRLQSLRDMKKSYATQKSLIKNALSYGSTKSNNKIIFDDDSNNPIKEQNHKMKMNGLKKPYLFDEANSEDGSDFEANFDIKEQFQGEGGQKLLELQSRYKNDKRFALDERFMEAQENDDNQMLDAEDNIEAEKNEQLKILEEVLGKKIISKSTTKKDSASRKTMLKFDPSQPEHSNLELTISEPEKKRKKKDKIKDQESHDSQKPEPEVSKEIFYKIPEKLKDTFTEKPQFSLLSMFGRRDENEGTKQDETGKKIKQNILFDKQQNPFKYDSSDDEDEIEDIPHKDTINSTSAEVKNTEQTLARTRQSVFWTEPFFFKSDDFRLQEGQDFIEKIKGENKEFLKIRRELKGIVKAKVRNNERKNKMFKKKLGGSKRRKHVRIKKALKR